MEEKYFHTFEQIRNLIGQQESIRLEFKSSTIFAQPSEKYIDPISKEVSAFANSEGGQIIIGIVEEKSGKSRIAKEIDDGVTFETFSIESFQQRIESNISPFIPGLRFIKIPLLSNPHRFIIVIGVPKGTTAYQANDKRYYGRSEFEVKALPDYEVRLRMLRPRIAVGRVMISKKNRFICISFINSYQ